MNSTALIYLIGIGVTLYIVYVLVEIVFERTRRGQLAETLSGPDNNVRQATGLRGALIPLEKPVGKYTPAGLLRKTEGNLYWAQMLGKWIGWNGVQFIALQLVAAAGALVFGLFFLKDPLMAGVAALIGWNYPAMSVNGVARRTRRRFIAQLPEFIQLVSAQMSANVSMEEAIQRTAKSPGLVGQWMTRVLQQAQGRDLITQLQREAQASRMPELIGMAVQLGFIKRGTAQQELMGQLAMSIAADYVGQAEQRAEKLGSELVAPMVIFYFVPFLAALLTVMAYPIFTHLFGGF